MEADSYAGVGSSAAPSPSPPPASFPSTGTVSAPPPAAPPASFPAAMTTTFPVVATAAAAAALTIGLLLVPRKTAASRTPHCRRWEGLVRHALIPDRLTVPPEYARVRAFQSLASIVSEVRGALTACAWLVAIGVGIDGATPLRSIMVTEVKAAVGHVIGLQLSARWGSSWAASRARPIVALGHAVTPWIHALNVVLLFRPGWLLCLSVVEAVCLSVVEAVTVPAEAALFAHMKRSADVATRAEIDRKNANQDQLVFVVKMVSVHGRQGGVVWVRVWGACCVRVCVRVCVYVWREWASALLCSRYPLSRSRHPPPSC